MTAGISEPRCRALLDKLAPKGRGGGGGGGDGGG